MNDPREFGFERHKDGTSCESPCPLIGTGIHELVPPINNFYREAETILVLRQQPQWRPGQTWFNVLNRQRPDLADKVRGTDLDPFYIDDRRDAFLAWVEENW